MNKLISKIVGVALGLSLAVGTGVAIGANTNSVKADAASGDSYTFSAINGTSSDSKWTFASAKNSGSSNPAMSSGQLRLYPKNSITFSGASGVTFTSAEFTCVINKNNKNVYPTGWNVDEGSITSYATSLTSFTVSSIDSSSFTLTIEGSAGNVGLTTVKMYYTVESSAVVDSVSLTGDAAKNAGGASSVTADYLYEVIFSSGSGNEGVNVSVSPSQGATVGTVADGEFSITYTENGTYTVTATSIEDSNKFNTFETVVTGVTQIIYEKVTSVNSLKAGRELVIGKSDGTFVMGTYGGGNNIPALSSTPNQDGNLVAAALPEGTSIFTLEGSTDEWKFEINGEYLHDPNETSKNYLYVDSTEDLWSVSISEGVATITNNSSSKVVKKNNSSALFSCYGSGQHDVSIYMIPSTDPAITISSDKDKVGVGETATLTISKENGATGTVSWSSSNDNIATVSPSTGDSVTLTGVGAGTATITASLSGCDDVTISIDVRNGTVASPYSVAEARAAITANDGVEGVYTTGIIYQIDSINTTQYFNATYWISDDGTNSNPLEIYRGKYLNNTNFTTGDEIKVGDIVTVYGNLTKYGSTFEYGEGNYLTSLTAGEITLVSISGIEGSLEAIAGASEWNLSSLTPKGVLSTSGGNDVDISSYVTLSTSSVPGSVGTTQVSVTVTPKSGSVAPRSFNVDAEVISASGIVSNGQHRICATREGVTYYLKSNGTESAPSAVTNFYEATVFTFTLVSKDTYTIKTGSSYLYSNSSNNGIRVGSTADNWTISVGTQESGAYDLKDTNNSRYLTLYNAQDWRGYDAPDASNRLENTDLQAFTATQFATEFLNSYTAGCNADGGYTAEGMMWDIASAQYALLSSADQSTLASASANESGNTVEQAVARYDYIVGKYGEATFENFMNRTIPGNSAHGMMFADVNNNALVIVVITAFVTMTFVGGYFFLRKKKEN